MGCKAKPFREVNTGAYISMIKNSKTEETIFGRSLNFQFDVLSPKMEGERRKRRKRRRRRRRRSF